jgi:hypothetical protein
MASVVTVYIDRLGNGLNHAITAYIFRCPSLIDIKVFPVSCDTMSDRIYDANFTSNNRIDLPPSHRMDKETNNASHHLNGRQASSVGIFGSAG